jgi:hypothetical protein
MLLLQERAAAHEYGLDLDPAYMADLEQDITACRAAYIGAAVTEIAVLRARLGAPLLG